MQKSKASQARVFGLWVSRLYVAALVAKLFLELGFCPLPDRSS